MTLSEQLMTLPTFKIVAATSPGKRWFLLLIRQFYRTFHTYISDISDMLLEVCKAPGTEEFTRQLVSGTSVPPTTLD